MVVGLFCLQYINLLQNSNHSVVGKKKDGTIELIIISSGVFDDSAEQQTLLMDKIENYMGYALENCVKVITKTK